MKINSVFFYFLIFTSSANTSTIGWYDPQLIETNIQEYHAVADKTGVIFAVYSRLINDAGRNEPQNFSIYLDVIGKNTRVLKLSEIKLPAMEVIFSLSPVLAVSQKQIIVVWQEPASSGHGMKIKYVFIDKNSYAIGKPVEVNIKDFDVFQPVVHMDEQDNIHLFFQDKIPNGKISLSHLLYQNGTFGNVNLTIPGLDTIGRGAFFPSIFVKNENIHIIYQSKQSETLTDELYYIKSKDRGTSFSKPERISKNNFNDFSPSLFFLEKNLELVWQSNESENWQIYYSPDLREHQRITNSLSNTYQPAIGYTQKTGRVIAWLDERVNPSQIFARFINLDDDIPMSKEHQVTRMPFGAINPTLINENENLYLFFIGNKNLYCSKADMETSAIEISSPGHPQNSVSTQNDVKVTWKIINEPSGIDGYAYLLDNRHDSIPDFYNLPADSNYIVKKGLPGGNYFFHIRYKDKARNESPVYTYAFSIDASSPIIAEINSSTHRENTPEKKHEFKINYSAVDDIGVKGYYYTLSANRGANLNNFTEANQLTFSNLNDGEYYFLIQAIDKTGKTSPVVSYKINIVPEDYDDFRIIHNIQDGQIETDFVDLSLQLKNPKKKLLSAYASLSTDSENPFIHGKNLAFTNIEGIFKTKIPVPFHKWGLYTLSIGLQYEDNSKSSIRNFHFEYRRSGPEEVKIYYIAKGRRNIIKPFDDNPKLIEEIKPGIELAEDRGLFKVAFSLPEKYKGLIQGYTYQVSDIPMLPRGELNYIEQPIYIYDLPAGIYYISVKPVYKNEKANKISNYSYLRFVIKDEKFWQKKITYLVLSGIILLVLISYRKKIIFYMSKYR